MPFTVTKMNTVHTGVITYRPIITDFNTAFAFSKSTCEDDSEYLIDEDSWSVIIEETFLIYDDQLDEMKSVG